MSRDCAGCCRRDMNTLLQSFMYLALVGFIASLGAHLAGYMGIEKPFGFNPWPLHLGIFVVWIPAIFVMQRLSREFPRKDMWKATLRGCPREMRTALYVISGYAFLSFFAFIFLEAGSGEQAKTLRGFSGHWLVFYYAAFAILYSSIHVAKKDDVRRCINGHLLQANEKYCSQCGLYVGSLIE